MTPRFVAGALVAFIRWRLKREVKNFMKLGDSAGQ